MLLVGLLEAKINQTLGSLGNHCHGCDFCGGAGGPFEHTKNAFATNLRFVHKNMHFIKQKFFLTARSSNCSVSAKFFPMMVETPYLGGVINPKIYLNHELGFKFSKHQPSGPMLSISWNVRLSVRPSVCPSVRLSVCSLLRYRLNVFLPPLPKVRCPTFLEIRNPWGKVMERRGLRFEHFSWEVV